MKELHVDELAPLTGKPRRLDDQQLASWQSKAEEVVAAVVSEVPCELLGIVVIWCKYARGKVAF